MADLEDLMDFVADMEGVQAANHVLKLPDNPTPAEIEKAVRKWLGYRSRLLKEIRLTKEEALAIIMQRLDAKGALARKRGVCCVCHGRIPWCTRPDDEPVRCAHCAGEGWEAVSERGGRTELANINYHGSCWYAGEW